MTIAYLAQSALWVGALGAASAVCREIYEAWRGRQWTG